MALLFSYSKTDVNSSNADTTIKLERSKVTGDAYGLLLDVSDVLRGTGATGPRSYGIGVFGDKTEGVLITAGCDDALLRVSGNNYVANAEIYNFRGLNCNVSNRSGGIVGALENLVSVIAKSGSVQSTIKGLTVDAQTLCADTGDEYGGLDVSLNREGGVNTIEYGLQLRTRGTINTAIKTAINIRKDATDYGFATLLALDAAATVGITASTSVTTSVKIPIIIAGVTYYIPAGVTAN